MYTGSNFHRTLITLESLPDAINNENRKNVDDPLHAIFRCDRARVVSIINYITGEELESIRKLRITYKKGEIVSCDNYDDKIFRTGIHYCKTKEATFSMMFCPQNANVPDGTWTFWSENGIKEYEGSYKNGMKEGKFVKWHDNGAKESEGSYKNGMKEGKWTVWYYNGNKFSEKSYKDG